MATGSTSLGVEGSLPCEEHPAMCLDLYCVQHDAVLCSTCLSQYHRECSGFQPLSDILAGNSKNKESKKLQKDVKSLMEQVVKVKAKRKEDQMKLKEETEKALKKVEEFRSLIDWVLDRMESKGKEYIQKRYKELNTEIVEEITRCDEMLAMLEKMKTKAKHDSKNVSLENFVRIKKGKYVIEVVGRFCAEARNHQHRSMVKFTVDPKVEKFARSLSWYGKDRTYLSFEQPVSFPCLYQIKSDNQFDVKERGDKHVCSITDLCQMTDGTLLATDVANRTVKQLDVLYQLVDFCSLPGEPTAVCRVSEQTAAVALKSGSDTVIQYLEVRRSLQLVKSFIIDGQCFGIACDGNSLFVSDGLAIYMYPLSGDFSKQLLCNIPAYHIAMSHDCEKLVAVCGNGGLVVVSKSGEMIRELTSTGINASSHITVDQNGQIFVSGMDDHSVLQYNHDLQKLGVLLTSTNGIKHPQAVTFDRINNRLVVSMRFKNIIKAFELT